MYAFAYTKSERRKQRAVQSWCRGHAILQSESAARMRVCHAGKYCPHGGYGWRSYMANAFACRHEQQDNEALPREKIVHSMQVLICRSSFRNPDRCSDMLAGYNSCPWQHPAIVQACPPDTRPQGCRLVLLQACREWAYLQGPA